MKYKHFAVSGIITHEKLKGLEGRFKKRLSGTEKSCRACMITPTRLFENQETEVRYKERKITPLFHGRYTRPCISLNHFLGGEYPIEDMTQLMLIYETINSPQILLEENGKGISAAYLSRMNHEYPIASLPINNYEGRAFLEALGEEYEETDGKVYVPRLKILNQRIEKGKVSPNKILETCGDLLGIDIEELTKKSREKPLPKKRAWTMLAIRELTNLSLQQIGDPFHRSHSAVLYNIRKIERETSEAERRLFLQKVKERAS